MKNKILRIGLIALAGILASLVMYLVIHTGIHHLELYLFNIAPSAAFLYNLGVDSMAYSLLLHFCYGTLWAFVLVYTFEEDVSVGKALMLSVILWLFMMLVYSPLIGWGIFGFGYAYLLAPDHPLYLESGVSYVIITLLVHLIYGAVLGLLAREWLPLPDHLLQRA